MPNTDDMITQRATLPPMELKWDSDRKQYSLNGVDIHDMALLSDLLTAPYVSENGGIFAVAAAHFINAEGDKRFIVFNSSNRGGSLESLPLTTALERVQEVKAAMETTIAHTWQNFCLRIDGTKLLIDGIVVAESWGLLASGGGEGHITSRYHTSRYLTATTFEADTGIFSRDRNVTFSRPGQTREVTFERDLPTHSSSEFLKELANRAELVYNSF